MIQATIQGQPATVTAVSLNHPLLNCPAEAAVIDNYMVNGRNVGLVLRFADGHTASLTYQEIRDLQKEQEL
jgi:hypothetical protein